MRTTLSRYYAQNKAAKKEVRGVAGKERKAGSENNFLRNAIFIISLSRRNFVTLFSLWREKAVGKVQTLMENFSLLLSLSHNFRKNTFNAQNFLLLLARRMHILVKAVSYRRLNNCNITKDTLKSASKKLIKTDKLVRNLSSKKRVNFLWMFLNVQSKF